MRNLSSRTIVETALWLVFALLGLYLTAGLGQSSSVGLLAGEQAEAFTPATWPRIIFSLIIVVAVVNFLLALLKGEEPLEEEEVERQESGNFIQRNARLFGFVSLALLYGMLLGWVGFYILTPFFILGILLLSGERRWLPLVGLSFILHLALILLFYRLLRMTLPTGTGVFYEISGAFQNFLYSIF